MQLGNGGDGGLAVGRLADHRQVGFGTKNHREAGAEQALVVDEQDPGGHRTCWGSGNVAFTRNPVPAAWVVLRVPP